MALQEVTVRKRPRCIVLENGEIKFENVVETEYEWASGEYESDDFKTTETTYTTYDFRGA